MRPRSPGLDVPNRGGVLNTVSSRQFSHRDLAAKPSYFSHIALRKFSGVMTASMLMPLALVFVTIVVGHGPEQEMGRIAAQRVIA